MPHDRTHTFLFVHWRFEIMYMTPPGTVVLSEWRHHAEIFIALEEIEGSPHVGPYSEGGWIVLSEQGIEFLENGIGIYVEEYWDELQTGLD